MKPDPVIVIRPERHVWRWVRVLCVFNYWTRDERTNVVRMQQDGIVIMVKSSSEIHGTFRAAVSRRGGSELKNGFRLACYVPQNGLATF
jgi:hypothetical protein